MKTILNLFKTGLLFTILTGILLTIGYNVGGREALLPFLMISIVINFISYWFSSSLAISMARAHPLDPNEGREIYEDVKNLSAKMNLPMPKLYMSEDPQPNAFATGRNPKNAAVCITKGLVQLLSRDEIQGVLAHELSHVKNRDILTGTIAAVMAGVISYSAQFGMFYGGREDRGSGNILIVILAPVAALLVQLAISRSREYDADYGAAIVTGKPLFLASALIKINEYSKKLPIHTNPALSSLYIQNPFSGKGIVELFSTHPSTQKRVEKLRNIRI
jgi:heat shock protein HtpX